MLMTPLEYYNHLRRTGSLVRAAAYRATRRGLMRVATGVNSENPIGPGASRSGTRAMRTESESGYYQDADRILYVSEAGTVYSVLDPDATDPAWKKCDYLSPDAEPTQPHAVDRQAFERRRKVLGIEA